MCSSHIHTHGHTDRDEPQPIQAQSTYCKFNKVEQQRVRIDKKLKELVTVPWQPCLESVVVTHNRRGWARDKTVCTPYPIPLHLNSKTKSNRRGDSGAVELDKITCHPVNDTVIPEREDKKLQAVNIVCRARLQTRVDFMDPVSVRTALYGKCDMQEFPACTFRVRLSSGDVDSSSVESVATRLPFLTLRDDEAKANEQIPPPKHTTISVSYCSSGSHGISGGNSISESLECVHLLAWTMWDRRAVPMNVRSFKPVNYTAIGAAPGCTSLSDVMSNHSMQPTYNECLEWVPLAIRRFAGSSTGLRFRCSACAGIAKSHMTAKRARSIRAR